jgi:hypothetical protein
VLTPQHHLAELAEEPAVADDPVLARQRAGQQGRLHRARHRGQHGAQGCLEARLGHGAQPGHVVQQPGGQPDHVDNE